MAYRITEIEAIGPKCGAKLTEAGIAETVRLLAACGSKSGRKATAEKTGFSAAQLLKWADMADPMRISGVAGENSDLLEAAGVDTVKGLKMRRPNNLAAKMQEADEAKKPVRQAPSEPQVIKWVERAKTMEPMISH